MGREIGQDELGKPIEEEQAGREKADYCQRIVEGLSQRLGEEFGKGCDRSKMQVSWLGKGRRPSCFSS
jgi:hypothetical protein